MAEERKFKTVVIDTINEIQNRQYISLLDEKGKAGFDEWKDFGTDILFLIQKIKASGATIIFVLGFEGTGKTVGASTLNPEETFYLNADNKPLAFPGGKKNYSKEKGNYAVPTKYDSIIKAVETLKPQYVFILGHTELYKDNNDNRQRLKVLGKMATKMNIEGAVVHCYYTKVDQVGANTEYRLTTRNSGYNTARSPMGMWKDLLIPNDYQAIINRIEEYDNE